LTEDCESSAQNERSEFISKTKLRCKKENPKNHEIENQRVDQVSSQKKKERSQIIGTEEVEEILLICGKVRDEE
jgi:hypothetical protein